MEVEPCEVNEERDEDLKELCNYMCFFINGIAYPQSCQIYHQQMRRSVQGSFRVEKSIVKKQYMGKFIMCKIVEG